MHWLERMGGPQASRIPVIVMSGAEPGGMRDRCLAAGAVDYFQKPVKIPELLEAIQEIFHPGVSEVPLELAASTNSERLRL